MRHRHRVVARRQFAPRIRTSTSSHSAGYTVCAGPPSTTTDAAAHAGARSVPRYSVCARWCSYVHVTDAPGVAVHRIEPPGVVPPPLRPIARAVHHRLSTSSSIRRLPAPATLYRRFVPVTVQFETATSNSVRAKLPVLYIRRPRPAHLAHRIQSEPPRRSCPTSAPKFSSIRHFVGDVPPLRPLVRRLPAAPSSPRPRCHTRRSGCRSCPASLAHVSRMRLPSAQSRSSPRPARVDRVRQAQRRVLQRVAAVHHVRVRACRSHASST